MIYLRRGGPVMKMAAPGPIRHLTAMSKSRPAPLGVDPPKIRKDFPETWIWDDLENDELVK
jgi:hypothetical protein